MIKYANFDESELDIPIYRIVKIERFFELLVNNKNTLVSPSLWEDPFEAFTSKAKIKIDGKLIMPNNRVWGQCWTTRINETDAMWRIYTPDKNGVKIRTTARKLIDSLSESVEVNRLKNQANENNRYLNEDYGPEISLVINCGKVKYLSIKKITDPKFLNSIFSISKISMTFLISIFSISKFNMTLLISIF